jgi:hypothetical protein
MIRSTSILKNIIDRTSTFSISAVLFRKIRILNVNFDFLVAASGYNLKKYTDGKWSKFSYLDDGIYSIISNFRLISRLFRAEIHFYRTLSNNKGICIAKKGIFLENTISGKFEKVFNVVRGSRPMALCEDREGNIFFGEYYSNKYRNEVNIYGSFNSGKSWEVVYTFLPNTIRHIHAIQLDPFTGFLWVTTGDENGECMIAFTKDKFKTLETSVRGGQEYRACSLMFSENVIIYGTDSPYIENYIKAIKRTDNSIQNLQKVEGSIINSCQIGNLYIISTTVEPSKINSEKFSNIWISEDGIKWIKLARFKKDIFHMTLFQFGNIRFPLYQTSETESLYFSGHALKGIDGHSVELKIHKTI